MFGLRRGANKQHVSLHDLFEQNPRKHYSTLSDDNSYELNHREIYDRICRSDREYCSREANANLIASFVNRRMKSLGIDSKKNGTDYKEYSNDLINNGLVKIPDILTKKQIEDINHYAKSNKIIDFYNDHKVFSLDNIPKETNVGRYTPETNLKCPHLIEAINNPLVLDIAEDFLGAKPTISVIMLMWSFANGNQAQQMQKFHRDNDDSRFCKLFILLNDVDDMEDGPHLYIKNTHS